VSRFGRSVFPVDLDRSSPESIWARGFGRKRFIRVPAREATSVMRAISSAVADPAGLTARYVDISLGEWHSSQLDAPGLADRTFGFFDRERTCSAISLQAQCIEETWMWSTRVGDTWRLEGAVTSGLWRARTTLLYEDVPPERRKEEGDLELKQILTVWERREDFPEESLHEVTNPPPLFVLIGHAASFTPY
jgi:hypothetical protein